jgi:hypothetical protein
MHATRLHNPGRVPKHLVYETIDTPAAAAGQALIRVHPAAITRDEPDWPEDRLPAIPSYELRELPLDQDLPLGPSQHPKAWSRRISRDCSDA